MHQSMFLYQLIRMGGDLLILFTLIGTVRPPTHFDGVMVEKWLLTEGRHTGH